jgi:hypothetical protein
MVEVYPSNIWTRAKWQQERAAAKVPRRACRQVCVADELDRFHMAMAEGIGPGAGPTAHRLDEKIRIYIAEVHGRHPGWATRITVQIADRARAIQDEFVKIHNAREQFNKTILLIKEAYEPAENDIEDWLLASEGVRLTSRSVDILVAGLRELYVTGQRLTYTTDRVDNGIWQDARRYWQAMDVVRRPNRQWLEGVNDLRMRLRPVQGN